MKTFGKFCAVLTAMMLSAVTNGIVIPHLWNWFIVPLGVVPIGFWLAIGLSLFVGLFTPPSGSGFSDDLLTALLKSFFINVCKFLSLGLGAIVNLFV